MRRRTWADRLSPVSAGMTLAVLILAVAVGPVFGEDNPCTTCLVQAESACKDNVKFNCKQYFPKEKQKYDSCM